MPEARSGQEVRLRLQRACIRFLATAHVLQPPRFAKRDRRPIDPPPVVRVRLWEVYDSGLPTQSERELPAPYVWRDGGFRFGLIKNSLFFPFLFVSFLVLGPIILQ